MKRRFIHLTGSHESLLGILRDGLLIRQRRRNVWKWFSRESAYKEREPQQFGMVSLHQFRLRPRSAAIHHFGPFGVELTPDWVAKSGFQEVLYVQDSGPVYESLKMQFNNALTDIESRLRSEDPTDLFPTMAYTNMNVAAWIGAEKWVRFLALFERMEPFKHRKQREWRYSRPDPYYGNHGVAELVDDLRRKDNWTQHIHVLKFDPTDVASVYLPKKYLHDFRCSSPPGYEKHRVRHLPDGSARIQEISRR
jgi:hypothetical protein